MSEQPDDKAESVMLSSGSPAEARLRRIADALQVQQSVLYNPPDAVVPSGGVAGDHVPVGLDKDCEALLRAYQRIKDPKEQRRLLVLVQEAAEQD